MTRFASIMGVAAVATMVLLIRLRDPDENGLREGAGRNLDDRYNGNYPLSARVHDADS